MAQVNARAPNGRTHGIQTRRLADTLLAESAALCTRGNLHTVLLGMASSKVSERVRALYASAETESNAVRLCASHCLGIDVWHVAPRHLCPAHMRQPTLRQSRSPLAWNARRQYARQRQQRQGQSAPTRTRPYRPAGARNTQPPGDAQADTTGDSATIWGVTNDHPVYRAWIHLGLASQDQSLTRINSKGALPAWKVNNAPQSIPPSRRRESRDYYGSL
jgi:hypothetical protein